MSRSRGKVHTERKPRKLTLPSALLARHEFDRLEQYLSSEAMSRADLGSVEQVLIGGAFGQHINIEEAIQIGLLPDLPWERFKFLGNSSAQGAYHALLSREARAMADDIARRLTYLELIADNTFMDEFTSALFLPHTDLAAFPSVKTMLSS